MSMVIFCVFSEHKCLILILQRMQALEPCSYIVAHFEYFDASASRSNKHLFCALSLVHSCVTLVRHPLDSFLFLT